VFVAYVVPVVNPIALGPVHLMVHKLFLPFSERGIPTSAAVPALRRLLLQLAVVLF
jgi:hypothetical protein